LRPLRKRTSKNQDIATIFAYFHTLGLSVYANIMRTYSNYSSTGGAENAGVENAGVENAAVENTEAITYGKPSNRK